MCDGDLALGMDHDSRVWLDLTQVANGALRTIRGVTLKVTGGECVMGT